MTPSEAIAIEQQIAVKINAMETKAAEIGQLGAEIDALVTPDFEALYSATEIAKASQKGSAVLQVNARLKTRLAALHGAFLAVYNSASFPRTRTGK